jgi:organic radical activating enzyme
MNRIKEVVNIVNPEKVILSGGEPLLYPRLLELCEFLHDNGIKILINTCGVFKVATDFTFTKHVDVFFVTILHGESNEYTRSPVPFPAVTFTRINNKKARDIFQLLEQLVLGSTGIVITNEETWLRNPFEVILGLKRMGKDIYINTPIFNREQALSVIEMAYRLEIPVHFIKLLSHGRGIDCNVLPFEDQEKIAMEMMDQLDPSRVDERMPPFLELDGYNDNIFFIVKEECRKKLLKIFPNFKISHSLMDGRCRAKEKRTLLVSGVLIGCVGGKGVNEALDVIKACEKKNVKGNK